MPAVAVKVAALLNVTGLLEERFAALPMASTPPPMIVLPV
jgi:hypothetical protein